MNELQNANTVLKEEEKRGIMKFKLKTCYKTINLGSVVLAKEQPSGSVEQNRDPRYRPT
jgi:hypothetical protein